MRINDTFADIVKPRARMAITLLVRHYHSLHLPNSPLSMPASRGHHRSLFQRNPSLSGLGDNSSILNPAITASSKAIVSHFNMPQR